MLTRLGIVLDSWHECLNLAGGIYVDPINFVCLSMNLSSGYPPELGSCIPALLLADLVTVKSGHACLPAKVKLV